MYKTLIRIVIVAVLQVYFFNFVISAAVLLCLSTACGLAILFGPLDIGTFEHRLWWTAIAVNNLLYINDYL